MKSSKVCFNHAVMSDAKHKKRGYGFQVVFINNCPDCGGRGIGCATCGNEPDEPGKFVFRSGKWYQAVTA